jgi:hypothetical protein
MQMPHDHESELDLLGWAERDQFVYYLTIAYMLTDPADWQAFRRAVYGAVVAALTLRPAPTGPYPDPRASPDSRDGGPPGWCSTASVTVTTRPSTGPGSSPNSGTDAAS